MTTLLNLCHLLKTLGNPFKISLPTQIRDLLSPACSGTDADNAETDGWSLP